MNLIKKYMRHIIAMGLVLFSFSVVASPMCDYDFGGNEGDKIKGTNKINFIVVPYGQVVDICSEKEILSFNYAKTNSWKIFQTSSEDFPKGAKARLIISSKRKASDMSMIIITADKKRYKLYFTQTDTVKK